MRYIENRYLEVNAAMKKCRKLLTGFTLIIGVLFSMTVYGSTESETEDKQSDSGILVVYFPERESSIMWVRSIREIRRSSQR